MKPLIPVNLRCQTLIREAFGPDRPLGVETTYDVLGGYDLFDLLLTIKAGLGG